LTDQVAQVYRLAIKSPNKTIQVSKENLERKIGIFSATNIVIANMIGAGIFITTGLLMENLGDPKLMLGLWFVGGIIALAGAFCYAEVGATIPKAGGEYVFLSKLFHPMLGFLSGWVSILVGFSAPIAASAIGFSEYLFRAYPGVELISGNELDVYKKSASILIIVLFSLVHMRGVRFGTSVQNILTILKIGLLVILIFAGLLWGNGSFDHFKTTTTSEALNWKTIALSLMWIMFAYSGWNATTYIGSEIKNPKRNLVGSLITGTLIVIILYILINVVFVFAIPVAEMEGVKSIGGLAVRKMFGMHMENIFSVHIAFALLSSISAFIILGPRVYFAMSQDGYFFKFASAIHPKHKVPYWSIILQMTLSIIIILSGTLEQILTYMGFTLGIFPLFVVAGLIKMRMSRTSKSKLPGYPLTAFLFLFVGIGILTLSFLERPVESSFAIGTLLVGIPFYYYFKKVNKPDAD